MPYLKSNKNRVGAVVLWLQICMGPTDFLFVCLYSLRVKFSLITESLQANNHHETYKKQEWPMYAESTSAFIWSSCVFRKHRPSLSAMTVYIFSMCGSRGNWTSNLGSISTVFTHRVTPHLCIKNVLWVLWSYKEIIVCFCYHAGNFATTESLLCLSYSSKYFSFLFPVKSVLKSKKEEISPLGSTMAKRPSGPLEVGTPFYQDGQLQVRVYWKNRGGMHSNVLIYSFVRIQLAPHYVHQSL